MSRFFLELFNISITASWLIIAILVIRLALRRFAPRWAMCVLWALVGIRLLFPFSIESNLSLLPSKEVVITDAVYSDYYDEQDIVTDTSDVIIDNENGVEGEDNVIGDISGGEEIHRPQRPKPQYRPNSKPPQYVDTGIGAFDDRINNAITNRLEQGESGTENPIKSIAYTGGIIWICGMVAMLLYAVINYILLRKRVATAIPDKGGIRRSEAVGSPFILGLIRPKIYLPFGLSADTETQVIAHERAHIKRHDHFIKPIGYVLLSVYWFNPLVWAAYILLCRDIEMACDEKVVKNMSADARKAYASALLECGVKHSRIAACPLAFGEIGVKQRVKNALNYKKPLFWIIIVSVIICIAVAIFFLTSPMGNKNSATEDTATKDEADNSDVSENTSDSSDVSNSDTSTEEKPPQDLTYSGDVYLEATVCSDTTVMLHGTPDFSANLPTCLKVLNEGVWMKPNFEINTDQFTYKITVGDQTVYYNVLRNFFYNPETGNIVFATQSNLGIGANTVKTELSSALYIYPYPTYPSFDAKETYLKYIEDTGFKYDAAGYATEINIAETNAIQAMEVHTYFPIVAAYDGTTTHFYNYETGELMHSQKGKFLSIACNNGGFMEGDAGTTDSDRCITIEDRSWEFTIEENHWHEGGVRILPQWYTNDQKNAIRPYRETIYQYGGYVIASNNRYTACRSAEIYNNINGPVKKVEDVINPSTCGKYGMIFNGKTVIPFEFDKVDTAQDYRFHSDEQPLGVYRAIKDGKTYYYSTNGTNLTPNGFVSGSCPRDNRALVYDGEKLYIIKFSARANGDTAFIYAVNGNTGKITTIDSDLSKKIYNVIVGDGWNTGKTDCHYKYTLFFGGDKYYYDPECGTLCELNEGDALEHGEYFTVTEELRNRINTALSQPDDPENTNFEPPKVGNLFDGHMYLYTYYATYHEVEKHDSSGVNSELVRQIMLNANWVDGEKSSEEYHYVIEFGHLRNCEIEYNEDINLLWDKHNGRYAFLDSAAAVKLSAIMRSPDVKFSGKTKTERFTIVESRLHNVAITDKNFFATDSKGNLVHIVWKDDGKLSEGCVVDVTYDAKFDLEGTIYYYFNDENGFKTNTAISAYEVKIVSEPKTESLNKNRDLDFDATAYDVNLKGIYGEKYGINGAVKVITSFEDMQAFIDAYPSIDQRGTQDTAYDDLTKNLSDGYFRSNTLLMLYVSNEYLFTDYTVNKVSVANGSLTVDYTATAYVGIGPRQVPNSIIIVEVKNTDIADCTKFLFNGRVVKPDSPKSEIPETVEYKLNYTSAGAKYNSPDDRLIFSITDYDVLQDVLNNQYIIDEDSPIYDISKDFFKEKALICVRILANNNTDFENLAQLYIENGALKAEFTYNGDDYENRSNLLCYFEVDKDLVFSFKNCEFIRKIPQ